MSQTELAKANAKRVHETATSTLANAPMTLESPWFDSMTNAEREAAVVRLFRSSEVSVQMTAAMQEIEGNWDVRDHVINGGISDEELAARYGNTEMPAEPVEAIAYLDGPIKEMVRDSIHCGHPRMIGHMTMELPHFLRPLSRLVTAMHQNSVKVETAKSVTFMEREALAMIHRRIYNFDDAFYAAEVQEPSRALGLFTSGGTLANVSALWIARNTGLGPDPLSNFLGVSKEGMVRAMINYGYKDAVVIGSALMHYSMNKAVDVLGLGERNLVKIPVDRNYQVDLDKMERTIFDLQEQNVLVVAVVGIAGATETGSYDPLWEIGQLAKKYGVHYHVDAAWGGPLIFSDMHRHKIRGIELADTVTLDGHKQLYMPMGCGMCFVKDPYIVNNVKKTANYIIRDKSYDLGKFTIEGSRPANAIYLHANLHLLGVSGYSTLVDRTVRITEYMAQKITEHSMFELVVRPMSNILLYRHVPMYLRERAEALALSDAENEHLDELNACLQDRQKLEGLTFVSRTTIFAPQYQRNVVAMRVVIANPLTGEAEIDAVVQDQLRILASNEFVAGPSKL